MRALVHESFGTPAEVIALKELPDPQPRPGQLRIRVLRSPIHNHDLATIRGVYGYKPKLPAVAGNELLGTVDALGEGVTGFTIGQRVAGGVHGAWGDYAILPAAGAVPIPDAIDDDRGAQLVAMPLSALILFEMLQVEPGTWIAQNAANGAVGRILMQIAQRRGVNIVNFVRRDDAAKDVKKHGAKHVVVTEGEGWQTQARDLTDGEGFARIIDSIAGSQSLEMQRLLAPRGGLIVFGGLAGAAMKIDPGLMIANELVVRGFWMTSWMARASDEERAHAMAAVFELALKNELPLPVGGVYSLDRFQDALRAAETPGREGKILLKP